MEQTEQNLTPAAERKPRPQAEKKEREAGGDYFAKIEEGMLRRTKEDFEPSLRKEYIEEGAEFLIDSRNKGVQTMVFMDKGARPLAGFFRALWRRLWPDESPPDMKFMVSSRLYVNYGPLDVARAFAPAKDAFENKTVLLVDEVVASGATLEFAKQLLSEAFPKAKILKGGMARAWGWRTKASFLDILPPHASGAYIVRDISLGNSLKFMTEEVEEIGVTLDIPSEVHTKAMRGGRSAKQTYAYVLRQVGKHETLDDNSLRAIDKKIAAEKDPDKKSRLLQIREAYEKLI